MINQGLNNLFIIIWSLTNLHDQISLSLFLLVFCLINVFERSWLVFSIFPCFASERLYGLVSASHQCFSDFFGHVLYKLEVRGPKTWLATYSYWFWISYLLDNWQSFKLQKANTYLSQKVLYLFVYWVFYLCGGLMSIP